ncbi:hypothetical protein JSO54_00895 [Riemerella anatipestifer]|uniref:hypothetical protein n=1 Tax=Riemerella anatipestifer TaxID=34085 RepID=UPI0013753126|nr:hypothetical protein [Riemerella anatipestifer]
MIKKLLSLTLVILPLLILAQLQSFTISLTGTPEICPNNGTLSWTTSGTTANSTISYSIYNVTNLTTPVTSTTSLTYVGLPAGTYRVVATQTLGTSSNQATSNNFTIADQKTPMTAVTTNYRGNEICGNDGFIRVQATGGRAPYRYQLLDDSNAVVSEFQDNATSYTFTGLKAANYRYRVIDACGTGIVGETAITYTPTNFTGIYYNGKNLEDCSGVQLIFYSVYGYNLVQKPPYQVKVSYTDPNTNEVVTLNSNPVSSNGDPMVVIPRFQGIDQLLLTVTTTDACGRTVTQTDNFNYSISHYVASSSCGGQYFYIKGQLDRYQNFYSTYKVNFIEAPANFDPVAYNEFHGQYQSSHSYGSTSQPLPAGTYRFQIIDSCGGISERTVVIKTMAPTLYVEQRNSCDIDRVNLVGKISDAYYGLSFGFVDTQITKAPQSFIDEYGPLPYIIPKDRFEIDATGKLIMFVLKNMPVGSYTFSTSNACNDLVVTSNITVNKSPSSYSPKYTMEYSCDGKFRFLEARGRAIYYQRYFPEQNAWGISSTKTHVDGSGTEAPYFYASSGEWQSQPEGRYRVIEEIVQYNDIKDNKRVFLYCDPVVVSEFEIKPPTTLAFSNVYAFACANGTYDVTLSASGGTAPLTYAIVSSEANDATTIKDNGTNPIFEGLAGGTYFFRVYDQCGNFQTRKLDIAKLGRPGIRMVPVCASNELSLVVDGLDYLKYEWTKDGEPNNILSTTNVLNLGTYTADKAGLYHVRISINSATSCINSTLDLKLTEDALTAAKAGTGQTVNLTYDENMGTNLNLFDYLQGNYDGFGTWTETTTPSSSLLIGNQWRVSSAQSGTYSFKYTVTGACGGATDTATVIINLAKVCYKKPVISAAGDALPTKVGITSLSRAGADAQGENWPMVRQGGWIALESNTKGFVVNRVPFDTNGLPVGIPVANFVAGMMVYDTTNNCLKVYNGSIWSCFSTQTCPE